MRRAIENRLFNLFSSAVSSESSTKQGTSVDPLLPPDLEMQSGKVTLNDTEPLLEADQLATKNMEKVTDEQIEELRDAFAAFDKDGNGYITTKELASILRSLGLNLTENQLCSIVNEVDFDGNGKIDFPEFVNMMITQGDQMAWNDKDLLEAFRTFDSDDKGFVQAAELRYVLLRLEDQTIDEKELHEMMTSLGLDTNRQVTFQEFKTLTRPHVKITAN